MTIRPVSDKDFKIVFTNGCFDVIHSGHIEYLKKSKSLGDILVVGINSDHSIKKLKGKNRPINSQEDRFKVLSELRCVDCVVIFDEKTPYNIIKKIKPDILTKGGDWKIENIIGKEFSKETIVIPCENECSSTNIIKKLNINDIHDQGVKVGVIAIIARNGKVLLGLRGDDCETARNEWAYSGGRMDYGEDPFTSIQREIEEETTMISKKKSLEFLTWTNDFSPDDNKHYISLVFFAKSLQGEPKITEPDKCKEWKWFDPDNLPDNIFWVAKLNIERYKERIKNEM